MGKYKILVILVFILLLTRVGALFFFIDKLFMCEELHHGTIAKEIMEGPDLPLSEYPPTNYGHGGFCSGILTIPFFALFGQNRFALQSTPVAFSVAILIMLFLFAFKFFNRRVAIITGLLYIFSSRIWGIFNLHNGLHFENVFFTVAAMYLFYEIIFNRKTNIIYYFSLGLISGLGTYWIYTFLMTVAAILLVWFLRDNKMFLSRAFYIFLAGFLVGMLPWFYYNLGTHFESIRDIILDGFLKEKNYLGYRTWLAGGWNLLRIIRFSNMLVLIKQDDFFGKLYLITYWLSFLYILKLHKFSFAKIIYSKESFVLIFPVVLLIIVSFYGAYVDEPINSSYYLNWRYVVGLFPFIFLTVAIALDRLFLKVRILKPASIAVFSIFILTGAIVFSGEIDFKNFASGFNQPGYSYTFLIESFRSKYQRNLYKILDNITKLSAPEKYEVLSQSLISLSGDAEPVDFKEYLKLSLRLDERHKPIFYRMLIKGLYYNSQLPLKDLVRQVNILSGQVDDKYKPYLYEGIGAIVVMRDQYDTAKYKYCAGFIDGKYTAHYYRGLSEPIFLEGLVDYVGRFNNCMTWLDKQYQPFYLEGIGEGLSKIGFSYIIDRLTKDDEEVKIFYDFLKNLEPAYKIHVLEGMGRGLSYFYSPNTYIDIYRFTDNFQAEDKKTILKAMSVNLKQ